MSKLDSSHRWSSSFFKRGEINFLLFFSMKCYHTVPIFSRGKQIGKSDCVDLSTFANVGEFDWEKDRLERNIHKIIFNKTFSPGHCVKKKDFSRIRTEREVR